MHVLLSFCGYLLLFCRHELMNLLTHFFANVTWICLMKVLCVSSQNYLLYINLMLDFISQMKRPCCLWGQRFFSSPSSSVRYITPDTSPCSLIDEASVSGYLIVSRVPGAMTSALCVFFLFYLMTRHFHILHGNLFNRSQASSSHENFLPAGPCFLCFRSPLPHWL